jgi:programmed cell death protein 5
MQKQMVLRAILTPEARSRLTNLRLSRPEYANTIEVQLINLAQSGNLRGKVTDLQLKDVLRKLARQRTRNTTIKRV